LKFERFKERGWKSFVVVRFRVFFTLVGLRTHPMDHKNPKLKKPILGSLIGLLEKNFA
jgi:hypothetical protein